jgi:hypothetical protein
MINTTWHDVATENCGQSISSLERSNSKKPKRPSVLLFVPIATVLVGIAGCAATGSPPAGSESKPTALISLAGEGEFVELERGADFSIVEVRRAPQGSVPASMYTLRGVCAVLRARGADYVTSTRVAGASVQYRLTFPTSPPPEALRGPTKSVFSKSKCAALRF